MQLPDDFDPGREYPLVIGLHGLGDRPDGFVRLWDEFQCHDFIFACPQAMYPMPMPGGLGFSWFLWDTATEPGYHSNTVAVEHVMALLDDLERDFLVSDVFLLGFSQGCTMVWNTGLTHPDRFDGLVGFGGWLDTGFLSTDILESASGSSVFIAHGVEDASVPFEAGEEAFTILSGMGCTVELHAFEGGHTIDMETLRDAEDWMRGLR
jgi:phospholipase/carboxylesterase